MKKRTFFAMALLVGVAYASCSKDDTPGLNDTESRLVGKWQTKRITVEQTGQAPVVMDVSIDPCYFIDFKNMAYPNLNSGLYANTKWAEDDKDCHKVLNAWKVGDDGRLLLASLDTLYADILILEKDTLAFRIVDPDIPGEVTTYEFR
jgi:hypothetical protein